MAAMNDQHRLEAALRGLYDASSNLAECGPGDSGAARRAVRDAEWTLERNVEALTTGLSREPNDHAGLQLKRNDVNAARRALDAAIKTMMERSDNVRLANREVAQLREEIDDIADRLAAIVNRHRYEATSSR